MVSGVADALAEMPDQHVACIPPPVKSAQLRDVVVKYLADRPQDRQKKGAHLTVEALAKAWPCRK